MNLHNETWPKIDTDIDRIKVGNNTYGAICVYCGGFDCNLQIGNYCSIAHNVVFLLGVDYPIDRISSFPFNKKILKNRINDFITKRNIKIYKYMMMFG